MIPDHALGLTPSRGQRLAKWLHLRSVVVSHAHAHGTTDDHHRLVASLDERIARVQPQQIPNGEGR